MIVTCVLVTQRYHLAGLRERIVTQKLDLCLMVMEEMSSKFFATRSSLAYFKAALKKLEMETGLMVDAAPNLSLPVQGADQLQSSMLPAFDSTMDLTGIDGFPSPSRWLYDLNYDFGDSTGLPDGFDMR